MERGTVSIFPAGADMAEQDRKTDAEWKEQLSREQYRVTRERGTEPAFTGKYWNTKSPGVYRCVCCGEALFTSEAKYDSGTGWPSFFEPYRDEAVEREEDRSHGMVRNEVHCAKCGAHLGHIFPDGPRPSGLRYCINSASLELNTEEHDG
jgi:peptide-methionine (R)-S-oxide reductase